MPVLVFHHLPHPRPPDTPGSHAIVSPPGCCVSAQHWGEYRLPRRQLYQLQVQHHPRRARSCAVCASKQPQYTIPGNRTRRPVPPAPARPCARFRDCRFAACRPRVQQPAWRAWRRAATGDLGRHRCAAKLLESTATEPQSRVARVAGRGCRRKHQPAWAHAGRLWVAAGERRCCGRVRPAYGPKDATAPQR